MIIKRIKLSDISISHTQTRAAINMEVADEYSERMSEGDVFPPIRVFLNGAPPYYLSRGFHRYHGALKCGFVEIDAEVIDGNVQDAIIDGAMDNKEHGLRRTNADKERSIKMFLDAMARKGENLSDRAIAEKLGVDHKTVAAHRNGHGAGGGENPQSGAAGPEKRTGADGRERAVKAKGLAPAAAGSYTAEQIREGIKTAIGENPGTLARIARLREHGAVDAELRALVADKFGLGGGHGCPGKPHLAYRGGPDPVFAIGRFHVKGEGGREFRGKELVELIREVYGIPTRTVCAPGVAEGATGGTMRVPGRPGQELGRLERGIDDEGATAGGTSTDEHGPARTGTDGEAGAAGGYQGVAGDAEAARKAIAFLDLTFHDKLELLCPEASELEAVADDLDRLIEKLEDLRDAWMMRRPVAKKI